MSSFFAWNAPCSAGVIRATTTILEPKDPHTKYMAPTPTAFDPPSTNQAVTAPRGRWASGVHRDPRRAPHQLRGLAGPDLRGLLGGELRVRLRLHRGGRRRGAGCGRPAGLPLPRLPAPPCGVKSQPLNVSVWTGCLVCLGTHSVMYVVGRTGRPGITHTLGCGDARASAPHPPMGL